MEKNNFEKMSFADGMECLKEYAEMLQDGQLELEEMVNCYTNAMEAAVELKKKLDTVKTQIQEVKEKYNSDNGEESVRQTNKVESLWRNPLDKYNDDDIIF